jgi:hypothetical protein
MTNTNKRLLSILNEKDVENLYRQYLTKKFGDIIFNSPFGCDGYGESKKHNIRLICEFKDELDLTSKINQVKILCQVLYYIKKFEVSGKILPSVILIGDRNECFTIHTNEIFNYLGMNFDWSIAPSNAHTNVELVSLMIEDSRINPHVFNIKDINDCVDKIKDLTYGVKRYIPITPHNVTEVFKHFEDKVIGKNNLDTNQMANLFVQLLVNPDENYLHPIVRRKTVVTRAFLEVNLKSREVFESFFSHFSREYTPQQREHLTAVVDRLVQDITRRKQGEFFTPTIWADKAHEYISSVYGEDWKEKYVVWDPAWGTGNLTRGYKFRELYASTLNYSDIQTANQMGYNRDANKFQFDFLNDEYNFLPKGLREAIESGRKIIVLVNSPYATSNNLNNKQKSNSNKEGISFTNVGKKMMEDGFDKSCRQLYAQFMYRIDTLNDNNNIIIAQFTQPTYKTGESYVSFRDKLLNKYECRKSFLFNGNHFADTKGVWSIDFSIFEKKSNDCDNISYSSDILEYNALDGFSVLGKKIINSVPDKNKLSKWVREEIKLVDKKDKVCLPHLSSALKVSDRDNQKEVINGYVGSFVGLSNNISNNSTGVGLFSSTPTQGNSNISISIIHSNFLKIITSFSARKLIIPTWENFKDEYSIPNVLSDNYKQFENDSIIYSLFNSHSQQSSLRQITYKEQFWDIKNEFFWMSKNEMTELANQNNYNELYNDARTDENRYVYNLLFGEQNIYNQLSPEAKDVLDSATDLVNLSIGLRRNFADDHNHLNSWDAGYAQLKLLWKEYYPVQFKEFRDKYKVLEDKMRPLVYELGFLLK